MTAKAEKAGGVELFVSTKGNDAWSGRRATPNAAKTDGPFATLQRALDEIPTLKGAAGLQPPVSIALRGGTYFLSEPVTIAPRHSGVYAWDGRQKKEQRVPVTLAAYKDEKPVLSGGTRITGWRKTKIGARNVWVAELPEVAAGKRYFRQLFVNGKRRFRPRLPAKGLFRIAGLPDATPETPLREGQRRFEYADGDLHNWRNLQDVEVVILQRWIEARMRVRGVDEANRLVTLSARTRFVLRDDHEAHRQEGTEYYVENVFEALTKPGQWYLDRNKGLLYYLPRPGEDMKTAEVVAPRLAQVLLVKGGGKAGPVQELHVRGIAFSHTEWFYPGSRACSMQAACDVPAAVSLDHARGCSFERCNFVHLGTYGVELLDGCSDVELRHCRIADLGAGGIRIWHGARRNTVADCVIADGGLIFLSAVGVLIGKSSGNQVLHNHIHHFCYTGISVGWTWGYAESEAYGNIVEYNHVHDIGQGMLSDMGGIYTLGVSPGTRIRYNLFHDVRSRGYGGWGIYTDEGSTDILIENNIAYNCNRGTFHQHYGRENVVRNNIFAFGGPTQIERTRIEPHSSFTFEHNIVYFEGLDVLGKQWAKPAAVFGGNLYWSTTGTNLNFGGRTFAEWQAEGMDAGSLIADPKFVNVSTRDFRLWKDSPALKTGFVPFDLSTVGPR
ncbi:MAG: right-handed parallel beta-helix repeat-containing protein [Kiritimatiellae bacterium]|nr:right-handed parallel beta-helix repeat-containing protein [Kiritimatiellia bacterium]